MAGLDVINNGDSHNIDINMNCFVIDTEINNKFSKSVNYKADHKYDDMVSSEKTWTEAAIMNKCFDNNSLQLM